MGTFTFLLFYTLQILLINKLTNDWIFVLAYGFSLSISGLFAFYYYKKFKSIRGSWKIFSLFYKRTTVITSVINEREIIINELEKARKEFVTYRDGPKQ
jgi:glycerol-3-phosphate O-acyltransferase/dihydroxyacetone phosphate acyltransferase